MFDPSNMGNLMTPVTWDLHVLPLQPLTTIALRFPAVDFRPPSLWKVGLQRLAQQDAMNGFGLPGPIDGAPRLRPRNGDRSVKSPWKDLGC